MKYSHVEVILEEHSDGSVTTATSSPRDNGVRTQRLKLKPEHWDIVEYSDLPKSPEEVEKWFKDNEGAKYDYLGLLGFLFRPYRGHDTRYFCSESVLEALGYTNGWAFHPGHLYYMLKPYEK